MALQARKVSGAFEKWAPVQGRCVVFLDEALFSRSVSLHTDWQILRSFVITHALHFILTASDLDFGSEAICRRDTESYASQRGS